MANNIEFAEKYLGDIDKIITQSSKTGFLADNAFKMKFSGSKTVYLPEIEMDGLGDYSRTDGYPKGDSSLTYTPYTLNQERGKQLFLDAQDSDESGISDLAGKLVGEFTRTRVIPEVDAYNISALFAIAAAANNVLEPNADSPVADLLTIINACEEKMEYEGGNMVALVNPAMYNLLQTTTELQRYLSVSDFTQGGLTYKVKNLNGVPIIPVSSSRMKTSYTFGDNGFAPANNAGDICALVLPKDSASFVKKVDKCQILSPDQVEDFDAYKINFRMYYDLICKNSRRETIFAIAVPANNG